MDAVIRMFLALSYQEQIEIATLLPNLIKMDFIKNLPMIAVEQIFLYLPVKDMIACSLVCKEWHRRVKDCYRYWMYVCLRAGLSEEYANIKSNHPESLLSSFALKVNHKLDTMKQKMTVTSLCASNCAATYLKNEFLHTYIFTDFNTHLEQDSCGTQTVLYSNDDNRTVLEYADPNKPDLQYKCYIADHSRILWATVTPRNTLLVATNSAEWIEFNKNGTVSRNWTDNYIMNSYQTRCTMCCKCCMVIEITRDDETQGSMLHWSIDNVILSQSESCVKRVHYKFNLSNISLALKHTDAIFIVSAALLPVNDNGCETSKLSSSHLLLVQFNSLVVYFDVYCCNNSINLIQKALFPPNEKSLNFLLDLTNQKNIFRLSKTRDLLAKVHNKILMVWNIRSAHYQLTLQFNLTNIVPHSIPVYKLVAVGAVYCLLQHNEGTELVLISTLTGELVHRAAVFINVSIAQQAAVCMACVRQDWINGFI